MSHMQDDELRQLLRRMVYELKLGVLDGQLIEDGTVQAIGKLYGGVKHAG